MPDKMKMSKNQLAMVGVLGLLVVGLLMTYIPKKPKPAELESKATMTVNSQKEELKYEELLEKRLQEILSQLEGAGKVEVMVTTSGSKERVLASEMAIQTQDMSEQDGSGGTRSSKKEDRQNKIIMQNGQVPYVVKENRPKIEGVLVLAEGAEDPVVKENITKAVKSLVNIGENKISVFKMVNK